MEQCKDGHTQLLTGQVQERISSSSSRFVLSRNILICIHQESQKTKTMFASTFINPFEGKELISLTSGLSPSDEVISDLLSAKSKGDSALKEFVQERLVDQRIGFFKPLSRLNLDSFTKLKTTEVKWFNSVSKDLSMVKLQ